VSRLLSERLGAVGDTAAAMPFAVCTLQHLVRLLMLLLLLRLVGLITASQG
jgi:hypothetical protein